MTIPQRKNFPNGPNGNAAYKNAVRIAALQTATRHLGLPAKTLKHLAATEKGISSTVIQRMQNLNTIRALSNGNLLRFYNAHPNKRNTLNRNANLKQRINVARYLRVLFSQHKRALNAYNKNRKSNRLQNAAAESRIYLFGRLGVRNPRNNANKLKTQIYGSTGKTINQLYANILGPTGNPNVPYHTIRHVNYAIRPPMNMSWY
jgi:hypothetical protein